MKTLLSLYIHATIEVDSMLTKGYMPQKNKSKTGGKPKIAVSYIRTDKLRPGSYDHARIARYANSVQVKAKESGVEIEAKFSDRHEPTDTAERPGLQRMLQYLSENKVDYVIVPHFSMMSRDVSVLLNLRKYIEERGAKLVSPEGEESALDVLGVTIGVSPAIEDKSEKWGYCEICRENMAPKHGCLISLVSCNGKFYDRIKVGKKDYCPGIDADGSCSECNAGSGQYHHWNCISELCPYCGEPIVDCDCDIAVLMKR